jgi:hypothetical protein
MSGGRADILPDDEEYGGHLTLGEDVENLIRNAKGRAVVEGQSDLLGQRSLMHSRSLFRALSVQKGIAVEVLDPQLPD